LTSTDSIQHNFNILPALRQEIMQKQKCSLDLYTNFLIANHNRYSGSELSKVSIVEDMCHDSVSRGVVPTIVPERQLCNLLKLDMPMQLVFFSVKSFKF
jgi:hypothetical protein